MSQTIFTQQELARISREAALKGIELRAAGTLLQLPSGMIAVLRPVAPDVMIMQGVIPSDLVAEALNGFPTLIKVIEGSESGQPVAGTDLNNIASAAFSMQAHIMTNAFMAPRVSLHDETDPEAGIVNIADLSPADQSFVVSLMFKDVAEWKPFQPSAGADLPDLGHGAESEAETVTDLGDQS